MKKPNFLNVNIKGNKKLVNTKDTHFFIWNIPAIVTCPYATPHCKNKCYACKAEKLYPQVKPSRMANFEASQTDDFIVNMINTIEYNASKPSIKGKNIVFRIHESGDFYNQAYVDKWLEIARHFVKSDINITFVAYTKSVIYLQDRKIPKNMVVRFSLWDDTKAEQIEIAKALKLPIYTADTIGNVNKAINKKGCSKCDCKDCANCAKCWDRKEKSIYCVIH